MLLTGRQWERYRELVESQRVDMEKRVGVTVEELQQDVRDLDHLVVSFRQGLSSGRLWLSVTFSRGGAGELAARAEGVGKVELDRILSDRMQGESMVRHFGLEDLEKGSSRTLSIRNTCQ